MRDVSAPARSVCDQEKAVTAAVLIVHMVVRVAVLYGRLAVLQSQQLKRSTV